MGDPFIREKARRLLSPRRCPIETVNGVWLFHHSDIGTSRTFSPPGHLLHLQLEGEYALETNGREYRVKPGDIVYYHESEEVKCRWGAPGIAFYSVSFSAPSMEPLPPESRVFPANAETRECFRALYDAASLPEIVERDLSVFIHLSRILLEIDFWKNHLPADDRADRGWWQIERAIRERRLFHPSLDELARLGHIGRASVVRACRAATGESPMRRVREIRLSEARGLLMYSSMNVTGVAEYLGYPRPHEFTREFSRFFGYPPTRAKRRENAPKP